jgi:hypothetical protein
MMMRSHRRSPLIWVLYALWVLCGLSHASVAAIPPTAPRTGVLAGRHEAFRAYCITGEGAKAFEKIRADLDRDYLAMPFPAEPVTYGDPAPGKRTSDVADKWRTVQDICGRVSGVAEAATLCWIVTGEEKYLAKAKEFLLGAAAWHFAPDWKSGAVVGASDILYNDEGHFRLWRKLPLVYDQIREELSPSERETVLAHFRTRGTRSAVWIAREGDIASVRRNSLEGNLSSHPVRFMPMTGIAALALWDDLPEAREWWEFAYNFYREQFSPWGGDDGGWAEGPAYWRGTFEHAAFQDALLVLGDPLAYASPFWKNSPLFAIYNVQPYRHTTFGDVSNAGHFNLEPGIADYMEHIARVQGDGVYRTYAALCTDTRPRALEKGLGKLDRNYPTAAEILLRNFSASNRPVPSAAPLSGLPSHRHFADIGWVSMHSALGSPDNDIHLTFKSSPYGSFSHSHADQNAFIVNAYGESLAINSAYREFHNSPHHDQWTRQTKSKNALLIDGDGQKPKSKESRGRITRFETGARHVWTTGDATEAYAGAQQDAPRVRRVTRDIVFVDQRYFVVRDRVELATAGNLSWLLHAPKRIEWNAANSTAFLPGRKASLTTALVLPHAPWSGVVTTEFPVPVDPKYVSGAIGAEYVTGKWHDQAHLTVTSAQPQSSFTVWAVLWPEHSVGGPADLRVEMDNETLVINRPDGSTDRVTLTDSSCDIR